MNLKSIDHTTSGISVRFDTYGECKQYTGYSNQLEWHNIETEYKVARGNLLKLIDQSSTYSKMAQFTLDELDKQYYITKNRVYNAIKLDQSLTAPMPQPLYRKNLKGILAYRAWKTELHGTLSPSVRNMDQSWKGEISFSDRIPIADESLGSAHGLHAHRIEAWRDNNYEDFISGLVDCYGTVCEHEDGILRAECARILCIFFIITKDTENLLMLTGVYESFRLTYPLVPIYIMTPYMKSLYIWREVLINYHMIQEYY